MDGSADFRSNCGNLYWLALMAGGDRHCGTPLVPIDVNAIERWGEVNGVNVVFSHRLSVFVAGTGKIVLKLHLKSALILLNNCGLRLNSAEGSIELATKS